MLEVIAAGIKALDALLKKVPAEQAVHVCRALELELARRRVIAQAEARHAARRGK